MFISTSHLSLSLSGSSQLSLYLLSGVNNISLYWKIQETEFCMLLEDNKTILNIDGVCYYRGNMTVVVSI